MAAESAKEQAKQEQEAASLAKQDDVEVDLDKLFDPVSKERQREIMSMEQHFADGSTNVEWLKSRVGVITGSRVANVVGHGFVSRKKFLQYMLWPSTNRVCRKFCDYGLKHEDTCEASLCRHLDARVADAADPLASYEVHHSGMIPCRADRSRGYSPDGYITERYTDGTSAVVLSEYKCPYGKRTSRTGLRGIQVYTADTRFDDCLYGPTRIPPAPYQVGSETLLPITKYYYDQVQWGMDILLADGFLRTNPTHCPEMRCYFAVWTPSATQICTVLSPGLRGVLRDGARSCKTTTCPPARASGLRGAVQATEAVIISRTITKNNNTTKQKKQ